MPQNREEISGILGVFNRLSKINVEKAFELVNSESLGKYHPSLTIMDGSYRIT